MRNVNTRHARIGGRVVRPLVIGLVASMMTVLAACGGSSINEKARDGKIRVAMGKVGILATLPWAFADQGGFFTRHGVDVEFVRLDSGPAALSALTSGSADVGSAAAASVIPVLRQSSKLLVLGDMATTVNSTLLVPTEKASAEMAKPFPENLRALTGLKIGVSALGSTAQMLVEGALTKAGVPVKDVTFISTGVGATQMAALSHGRVDVVFGDPSTAATFKENGLETMAVVEFGSSASAGPKSENALLLTNVAAADFKKRDAQALNSYCLALRESIDWANDPRNIAKVGDIVAAWLDVPRSETEAMWAATSTTLHDELSERMWTEQPEWNLGGEPVPAYKTSVDATCGK